MFRHVAVRVETDPEGRVSPRQDGGRGIEGFDGDAERLLRPRFVALEHRRSAVDEWSAGLPEVVRLQLLLRARRQQVDREDLVVGRLPAPGEPNGYALLQLRVVLERARPGVRRTLLAGVGEQWQVLQPSGGPLYQGPRPMFAELELPLSEGGQWAGRVSLISISQVGEWRPQRDLLQDPRGL